MTFYQHTNFFYKIFCTLQQSHSPGNPARLTCNLIDTQPAFLELYWTHWKDKGNSKRIFITNNILLLKRLFYKWFILQCCHAVSAKSLRHKLVIRIWFVVFLEFYSFLIFRYLSLLALYLALEILKNQCN